MSRILFAAAALLLPAAVLAAPVSKAKPAVKHAVKTAALVCPVTGETIASVKEAAGASTYKGKKYFFCCASCKPAFDKEPQKYVKTAAVVKPVH